MAQCKYVICMILFLFSATVSAEFYRFVDKDGTIHYTDDPTKIPENQLAVIQKYKEYESDTRFQPENVPKGRKSQTEKNDIIRKQIQINQREVVLYEEFQMLMKEKEGLEAEREGWAKKPRWIKRRGRIDLSNRAAKLNEKIKNYERKKDTFNNEVDASKTTVEKALTIEKTVIRKSKGGVRY